LKVSDELRTRLVDVALEWERTFGNAPLITTVLSEYDAARLLGCPADVYSRCMTGVTAVQKGHDFIFAGARYQVKGNRPSGKPGSFVTWVPKATNYDWDFLIWVLYDSRYNIQEAWKWEVANYREAFDAVKRLSPAHLRAGDRLA
jgi:hypothetical protein